MKIVEWFNSNDGFILAVLTFIYVIATILICIFNYKSAKATKEQNKEIYNQYIENNRAYIVPKITEVEGNTICLTFHNIGKNIAKDVIINISEEWLCQLKHVNIFSENYLNLKALSTKKLFLTVDQKITYGLYVAGNGTDDYKLISKYPLKINITYNTLNKDFYEEYEIPFNNYNYMINTNDYTRLTKKEIDAINGIKTEIKNLANTINDKWSKI